MDMITMVERFVCGARTRRHIIAIGDYVKEHTALPRVPFATKIHGWIFVRRRERSAVARSGTGMEEKVAKVLARKLGEVATKEDVFAVKEDVVAVKVEIKAEFKKDMGTFKEYVDLRFDGVDRRFDSMDRSLNLLKWLIGLGFIVLTVLISVLGLR